MKNKTEDKFFCPKAREEYMYFSDGTKKSIPQPLPQKHNFLQVGGDCQYCGANQNEISGRKLKRAYQKAF